MMRLIYLNWEPFTLQHHQSRAVKINTNKANTRTRSRSDGDNRKGWWELPDWTISLSLCRLPLRSKIKWLPLLFVCSSFKSLRWRTYVIWFINDGNVKPCFTTTAFLGGHLPTQYCSISNSQCSSMSGNQTLVWGRWQSRVKSTKYIIKKMLNPVLPTYLQVLVISSKDKTERSYQRETSPPVLRLHVLVLLKLMLFPEPGL